MSERLLEGKTAVITGSGSGVGKAAALLFAEAGAKVICADVQDEWIANTVSEIKSAGGEAKAAHCDVRKREDIQAAVDAAVAAYGRLDIIYNNAGVSSPLGKTFLTNTDDEIDRLTEINFRGVLYGCQIAGRQFVKQGGGGVIVNTASAAGLIGWGGSLYCGTKGAVVNLTRALAIELASENIRVNSVCPGVMVTNFGIGAAGNLSEATLAGMAKIAPIGRITDASEPARVALFLASDHAITITGTNIPVDGGMTAGKK